MRPPDYKICRLRSGRSSFMFLRKSVKKALPAPAAVPQQQRRLNTSTGAKSEIFCEVTWEAELHSNVSPFEKVTQVVLHGRSLNVARFHFLNACGSAWCAHESAVGPCATFTTLGNLETSRWWSSGAPKPVVHRAMEVSDKGMAYERPTLTWMASKRGQTWRLSPLTGTHLTAFTPAKPMQHLVWLDWALQYKKVSRADTCTLHQPWPRNRSFNPTISHDGERSNDIAQATSLRHQAYSLALTVLDGRKNRSLIFFLTLVQKRKKNVI